ncbi:MAG: hypothetical protein HC904_13845 [Blastochloris sp.]|nr:hypothetical protein [Blastochloris sp.]
MGLWNPARPDELNERITHEAESTRGQIVPRKLVEKEIRDLVEAAAKQYPKLKDQASVILWGPAQRAYASHDPTTRKAFDLRQGAATDWNAAVGQKNSPFDNRIIEQCVLIPRMNVCKMTPEGLAAKQPEARLAQEVVFLLKLKNMRLSRHRSESCLSAEEIQTLFGHRGSQLSVTSKQWQNFCEKIGGLPIPPHLEVKAPREGGRSSFCRPALRLVKELILSGEHPQDFHAKKFSN